MHVQPEQVLEVAKEILARQQSLPSEMGVMKNESVLFNLVGACAVALVQTAEGSDAAQVLIEKILSGDKEAVQEVFSKYKFGDFATLEEKDRKLHEKYSPMNAKVHALRFLVNQTPHA